jgi:hypothetical protein
VNPVNPDLFAALVAALPVSFLKSIHEAMPHTYHEAFHAMHYNPLLGSAEASGVVPHYRRAVFETALRKAAVQCGLQATSQPNSRRTHYFTVVRSGNIVLTASHVHERHGKVRRAQFRSDYSAVNQLLAQRTLDVFDTPEVFSVRDGSIYCILVHGPHSDEKDCAGFMQLAIPDPRSSEWLEVYEFEDVYRAACARQSPQQQDGAIPKLKRSRKKGGGETGET